MMGCGSVWGTEDALVPVSHLMSNYVYTSTSQLCMFCVALCLCSEFLLYSE